MRKKVALTATAAAALIVLPADPASSNETTTWLGNIDSVASYHGGVASPYLSFGRHVYDGYPNPVDSTLTAVTCEDNTVWLGSLQHVPANNDAGRTLVNAMAPDTCWKVRVRNSQNSSTYGFGGFMYSYPCYLAPGACS